MMHLRRKVLILLAIAAIGMGGCSDDTKKAKKIRTVEGIAKMIDLKNNLVSMEIVDKEGRSREIPGSVREDTEVLINGRMAKLDDIREGDKVRVSGYREGKDEEMKFVATRVEVQRAKDMDWKSTAATTQPSTPPKS